MVVAWCGVPLHVAWRVVMSAYLKAAAQCDPNIVRKHRFEPNRAFETLKQEAMDSLGERDQLLVSIRSGDSQSLPQIWVDRHFKYHGDQSALLLHTDTINRLDTFRDRIAKAKLDADREAAAAKAAIRSKAHMHNAFAVVTGQKLALPQVDLTAAMHCDLVDRTAPPPVAPPVQGPTDVSPSSRPGVPRKTSERSRKVDAVHARYRDQLLAECQLVLEAHPKYRAPIPPMPMVVLKEDGDAWRRGQ